MHILQVSVLFFTFLLYLSSFCFIYSETLYLHDFRVDEVGDVLSLPDLGDDVIFVIRIM